MSVIELDHLSMLHKLLMSKTPYNNLLYDFLLKFKGTYVSIPDLSDSAKYLIPKDLKGISLEYMKNINFIKLIPYQFKTSDIITIFNTENIDVIRYILNLLEYLPQGKNLTEVLNKCKKIGSWNEFPVDIN